MEIGFNNDVVHRGVTFHIQTEDHGTDDTRVSTHIFLRGQVLDTKTVDYAQLLEGLAGEERREKIRKVMVSAHKALYNKLFSGDYDSAIGEEGAKAAKAEIAPEEFVPAQERVPQAAQVVEEDGKVTFTFDSGEAVDLKSLSRQLSEIDVFPPDEPTGNNTGGHDFTELMFEVENSEVAAIEEIEPAPRKKITWKPTGVRAFQGLVEPEADMTVIDQVSMFLDAQG